jgi:hypothetical protein
MGEHDVELILLPFDLLRRAIEIGKSGRFYAILGDNGAGVFLEWVAGLPLKYNRDGTRKFLFKKLAKRWEVPSQLLYRRKRAFSLPLVHWMRKELKNGP